MRSVSFEIKETHQACTRFFSFVDKDYQNGHIDKRHTQIIKRKYRLYKGFEKITLDSYSDDEVEKYF